MEFRLSEEQEMLKKMARDFCANECPPSKIREIVKDRTGYPTDLWRKMADLGWMGLAMPEAYGGSACSFLDLAVLLDEMGRAALVGPFFSTVVVGGSLIMNAGTEEQKKELLTKIGRGELIVTLALTEPSARYDAAGVQMPAIADRDDYVLSGTKLFVPDAHLASMMICAARTGDGADKEKGITLFLVDARTPGITCEVLDTISGDRMCEVRFNRVRVSRQSTLGQVNEGWQHIKELLPVATVAKCIEMVGAAQQVLDMTVAYAKDRVQFGRPIGSFQAIQHHCANMAADVDGSRLISYQAAWMISKGLPCEREIAMAKAWTSDAYRRVTVLGHQVHGAIAFSEDHDMHLYSKRSRAFETAFGDSRYHREVVAGQIGL